ncbi:MAG: HAD family hydrolase [Candidatus Levyibacteriota bacterium]
MKFKAIVFDIDGTAIPTQLNATPSLRLIKTIKNAQKRVKICAATGRSLPHARKILQSLDLKDPCIISGGTQIIDPTTEKTLWEKRLSELQVTQVMKLYYPYSYNVGFSDEIEGMPAKNKKIHGSERII